MPPLVRLLLQNSALMLSVMSPMAMAADGQAGKVMLLAELIIVPEKAPSKSTSQSQREKAGRYQGEAPANLEDDEVGILAPRGGAPTEEKAFENRNKARAYQPSGDNSSPPSFSGSGAAGSDGGQPRHMEQRNRARAYTWTGNAQDMDLSHVGRDGIPLVPCHEVDNVSGRIGDDTMSGSIVHIFRDGRQVKVRCR
jgi:hypothetical protein